MSYKSVYFKTPLTDLCGYERFLTGLNTYCRLTSQSCYVQVLQVSVDWQITTDVAVSDYTVIDYSVQNSNSDLH